MTAPRLTADDVQQLEYLVAAQDALSQQIRDFIEWWGPTIARLRRGIVARAEDDDTGAGAEFLATHYRLSGEFEELTTLLHRLPRGEQPTGPS